MFCKGVSNRGRVVVDTGAVNRRDVIGETARRKGLTILGTNEAVGAFLETLRELLVEGEEVHIRGLGIFEQKTMPARRLHFTDPPMDIGPRRTVKFVPSETFRVALNTDHEPAAT